MKVLIIAPHPDDEAIGCGGAVCLHVEKGDQVSVVFLTSGERGVPDVQPAEVARLREAEAQQSACVLGLASIHFLRMPDCGVWEHADRFVQPLSSLLRDCAPEFIYLPHDQDSHPDHLATPALIARALAHGDMQPQQRRYEVWTPMTYFDDGEDIGRVMRKKIRAIRCYRSQVNQLRYDRAVRGLNQYRGATAWGCGYAEVFQYVGP